LQIKETDCLNEQRPTLNEWVRARTSPVLI